MSKSHPTMMDLKSNNSRGAIYDDACSYNTETATVIVSNSNKKKMSVFSRDGAVATLMIEATQLGDEHFLCFSMFMTLLEYAKPESLKDDANCLLNLASNDTLGDAQLTSKAGRLFGKFDETGVDLPEKINWFPDVRSRLWLKRLWSPTPTNRDIIKRMLKRFKHSLRNRILENRKIADILLRYLVLVVHLQNPPDDREIVPLSDGDTAAGTRELYLNLLAKLDPEVENHVIIQQAFANFYKFPLPPLDVNSVDNTVEGIRAAAATHQNTGMSTLTKSQTASAVRLEMSRTRTW